YIEQRRRRTIMEVGRPRGEPTEDGSFDLADVSTLAGNHRAAWICDHECLSGKRAFGAFQREHRQSGDVKRRRLVGSGIGDADVQRRLDRMIADIRCVMAGATEPSYRGLI